MTTSSASSPSTLFGIKECCFKGYEFPTEPKGTTEHIAGLNTYVASPPAGTVPKEGKAVVVFPDIFGHDLRNVKVIADELSQRLGVTVYSPDYLCGRPIPKDALDSFTTAQPNQKAVWTNSLFNRVGSIIGVLPLLPRAVSIRDGVIGPRAIKFLRELRTEKRLDRIGLIGFCLGGTHAIYASGDPALIECAVIAHPGPASLKKCTTEIKVPTSWILAEEDWATPPSKIASIRTALEAKSDTDKIPFEMHEYKGTVHGFASRAKLEIPEVREAFQGALEQEVRWLKRWIVDSEGAVR